MSPSKAFVALSCGLMTGVVLSQVGFSWLIFGALIFLGLIISSLRHVWAPICALTIVAASFGFVRASFGDVSSLSVPDFLSSTQQILVERVENVIGGEEKNLFIAMTLGEMQEISLSTQEALNRTGTRHIVSISGLHMTIVAVVIFKMLIFIGLWRKQAFWAALLCLGVYILMVGAPSPAVRSGIMAGLYLTATQLGRLSQSWRLLLAAGAAMILIHPSLVSSISFQLSFGAMIGIVLLFPFFQKIFSFIQFSTVRDLISLSLAAQATTWPLVAFYFGNISLISIVANLLVVPLLPVVMISGILLILVGWMHPLIASVVVWPSWLVLHAVLWILQTLSALPYGYISRGMNVGILTFYYILLIAFFLMKARSALYARQQ